MRVGSQLRLCWSAHWFGLKPTVINRSVDVTQLEPVFRNVALHVYTVIQSFQISTTQHSEVFISKD